MAKVTVDTKTERTASSTAEWYEISANSAYRLSFRGSNNSVVTFAEQDFYFSSASGWVDVFFSDPGNTSDQVFRYAIRSTTGTASVSWKWERII